MEGKRKGGFKMYQITFSDEEEVRLRAIAAQTGQTIEALVHNAVTAQYARATTETTQKEHLLVWMRARGHLAVEDEVLSPEEGAREMALPPYGSKEEERLLRELAREAGEAFQATGTTIADDIVEERGE